VIAPSITFHSDGSIRGWKEICLLRLTPDRPTTPMRRGRIRITHVRVKPTLNSPLPSQLSRPAPDLPALFLPPLRSGPFRRTFGDQGQAKPIVAEPEDGPAPKRTRLFSRTPTEVEALRHLAWHTPAFHLLERTTGSSPPPASPPLRALTTPARISSGSILGHCSLRAVTESARYVPSPIYQSPLYAPPLPDSCPCRRIPCYIGIHARERGRTQIAHNNRHTTSIPICRPFIFHPSDAIHAP